MKLYLGASCLAQTKVASCARRKETPTLVSLPTSVVGSMHAHSSFQIWAIRVLFRRRFKLFTFRPSIDPFSVLWMSVDHYEGDGYSFVSTCGVGCWLPLQARDVFLWADFSKAQRDTLLGTWAQICLATPEIPDTRTIINGYPVLDTEKSSYMVSIS